MIGSENVNSKITDSKYVNVGKCKSIIIIYFDKSLILHRNKSIINFFHSSNEDKSPININLARLS